MKINDIDLLFESFKDAKEKFIDQGIDQNLVDTYIDKFKQLASKNIIKGSDKDIGKWIKAGFDEFSGFIDSKEQVKTKSEVKKSKKKESIVVYEDDDKMVVIPLSKDASCYYGRQTQWCTAATKSDNEFIKYFYIDRVVLFYVLMSDGKKFAAAYSIEKSEFEYFDETDEDMTSSEFEDITGINESMLVRWYKEHRNIIENARDLNKFSEEEQLKIVNKKGSAIRRIDNPSEEVQLAAVKENGWSIRFIKNPSEKLQLVAVKQNSYAIKFIENPSEKIQLAAVKENSWAIQFIANPSEKIQLAAVKQEGYYIQYIENPCEEAQLEAVKQHHYAINWIVNPTEKAKALHKELWES